MNTTLKVVINGDNISVASGASVESVIGSYGLLPQATAVQRNDQIVPRSAYGSTVLEEGDVIELVRFVGGG